MKLTDMAKRPLLTARHERNTLSAKKSKKQIPCKNTLMTPFLSQYFPIITTTESNKIKKHLNALPRLVAEKKQIQWNLVKAIPKAERKAFREQYREKLPNNEDVRNNLVFGVNNVTEHLERNRLEILLLTTNVNPPIMIQHVLDLCAIDKVPVLIVEDLRTCLFNCVGIASTSIGICTNTTNPILNALVEDVTTIWSKYPPPDDYIFKNAQATPIVVDEPSVSVKKEDENPETVQKLRSYHLHRQTARTRVFTPAGEKKRCPNTTMHFMSLNIQTDFDIPHIGTTVARVQKNWQRKPKGFKI